MGIAAALCAALTAAMGARAQEVPCSAQTAGQLLCQQSRLCQCEYFAGGVLDDTSAGYRWDCGVFRPQCESEAATQPALENDGEPPRIYGRETAESAKAALETLRREIIDLVRGDGQSPWAGRAIALDLVAAEGLDADLDDPGAAGRPGPDDTPVMVATDPAPAAVFDLVAAEGLDADLDDLGAAGRPGPDEPSVAVAAVSRWGTALVEVPRPERRISKAPVPRLGDRFAQQVAQAKETRIRLEMEIAALQGSLRGERQRIVALEDERDDLDLRRIHLSRQLEEMGKIQKAGLDRLTDHTLLDIALFEETVAMAGLNVAALLPGDGVDGPKVGQGGPFIPGEFLTESDPVQAAETSLSLLDDQVARWEGLQELLRSLPLAAPLEQFRISSGFGPRRDPVNGRVSRHLGLDFRAPLLTPVLSTAPGEVVFAGWKGRYGRLIEIDHGYGIRTRYAHLRKILFTVGQQVGHREMIALVGTSGRSTGPHVHYEVLVDGKPHDPMNFLKAGIHVFKVADREDALSGLKLYP
jgi:murein DD-endopeptidase MepM/ murein hydrolase activator NlpD